MADLNFNLFGNAQLSASEVQDKLVSLQKQMNYGFRNLDSLNVKRLNTEVTVIKSNNGEVEINGTELIMRDETSKIRCQLGLSTAGVYRFNLWSSNSVTTDYDQSSNAAVYINSSGEVQFADKIKTKKDAEIGTIITVGSATQYEAVTNNFYHGIAMRAVTYVDTFNYDMLQRVTATTNLDPTYVSPRVSFEAFAARTSDTFQTSNYYALDYMTFRADNFVVYSTLFQVRSFAATPLRFDIKSTNSDINLNMVSTHTNYINSDRVIVLNPAEKAYMYTTNSTNEIATKGYTVDNYVKLADPARPVTMDYSTYTGDEGLFATFQSTKKHIVTSVSTDRRVSLEFSTVYNNFVISRNSSQLRSVIMTLSTDAYKLTWIDASSYLDLYRDGIYLASFMSKEYFSKVKSTARQVTMDYSTYTGSEAAFIEFDSTRKNIVVSRSTDRRISFDYTTALNNLVAHRNSSKINSVVLTNTTQALQLNWSTANSLPSLTFNTTIVSYLARSAGESHRFQWVAASSYLNLQVAGANTANFIDKNHCARNMSTDRIIATDTSTITGTTFATLEVYRNSTMYGRAVMAASTNERMNLEYIVLATTVGSVLETSGEYLIAYTTGRFIGGLKFDT